MNENIIVHIFSESRINSPSFIVEKNQIDQIINKYNISNIIFYKGISDDFDKNNNRFKSNIIYKKYLNTEDLKQQIININETKKILFINTPLELLIGLANELMKCIGLKTTDNPNIFRDKSLQRTLIQNYNPQLGIKFLKLEYKDLIIENILYNISYPFIIKPVNGVLSSGVSKIRNLQEFNKYKKTYHEFHDKFLALKGINVQELLIEEFIDGEFYSIDYFVNSDGDFFASAPIRGEHGINIGIDDYFHFAAILSSNTLKEINENQLNNFIKNTIKACGIRNTFIHHEFKINSKKELKTIELNGRIGGKRLDIYYECFGSNLYELILGIPFKRVLICNYILFSIFSTKKGILKGFNENLITEIEAKKSVFHLDIDTSSIGKITGLTKNGFGNHGHIFLKGDMLGDLEKDYIYVKNNYKNILIIDESI